MTRQVSLSVEHALLGFLRHKPSHGYAIHHELFAASGLDAVWQLKLSQLYALLGKLEDVGYLAATVAPQEKRPSRKVFRLTADGRSAFVAWVRRPVDNGRSLRLEFLLKLYFARQEGEAVASQLLAAQRAQCRRWLALEQTHLQTQTEAGGGQYGRLIHQFRLGQIQAMLHWLTQCEESLRHAP